MNEYALNGLDAELEQRQWEIGAIVEHLREMKERCGKHRRYQDLLKLAINDLLYVDDSLLTIRSDTEGTMSEELTLLPCPLCQATAHVEYHNGYLRVICEGEPGCPFRMGGKRFVFTDECYDWWNNLPRALTWTTEPQLGAWNWWKDEDSRIPRYVYQDGTVAITMQIDRVPYQKLGGQWAGPIHEPREPK